MNKKSYIFITAIFLLIMPPVTKVILHYNGWKFLLYLVLWVFLPGITFIRLFFGNKISDEQTVLFGFWTGAASLMLQYYPLQLSGNIGLIKFINPVLFIAGYLYIRLINKNRLFSFSDNDISVHSSYFAVLLFAVYICAFTLNFSMPRPEDISYQDLTWEIGNINRLSSHTPFADFRVYGVAFRYHYFSTLFYAIARIIFPADSWVYITQCTLLFIPFIVSFAFYLLFRDLCHNEKLSAFSTACVLTGMSAAGSYNSFMFHWASNINSVGFATSCSIALFLMVKKLYSDDYSFSKIQTFIYILLCAVITAYLAGIKGPFVIVFLTGFACFMAVSFIKNKSFPLPAVLYFIFAAAGFGIVYNLLLSSGAGGYLGGFDPEYLFVSALNSPALRRLYNSSNNNFIVKILVVFPSLFLTITICALPVLLCAADGVKYVFSKNSTMEPDILLASFIAAAGLAAYYLFSIEGSGQMYLLFAAMAYIGYISLNKIIRLCNKFTSAAFRNTIISLCIVICALTFVNAPVKSISDFSISSAVSYFTEDYKEIPEQTELAFQAYDWINSNTPKDSIIASNRQKYPYTNKDATYHFISAFGQRQCYMEGYAYSVLNFGYEDWVTRILELIELFYPNWTDSEKHRYCVAHDIDYIVVFKDAENNTLPSDNNLFALQMDNPLVAVYSVVNS